MHVDADCAMGMLWVVVGTLRELGRVRDGMGLWRIEEATLE